MNRVTSSRRLYSRLLSAGALVYLSLWALSMVGCGGGGSVTTSPATSSAVARLSPSTIDFGDVAVGSQGSSKVVITNSGLSPLNISAVAVSAQDFNTPGLSLPLAIPPGQSSSFEVTFSPQAAGSTKGTVSLADDASAAPLEASISGMGVTRKLVASPATVSFGNVGTGDQKTQSVTLTSTGTASVEITQAKVAGAGFSIRGLSLPLTLAADQSTTLDAIFAPASQGAATGTILFSTSASGPSASVSLAGAGVTGRLAASTTKVSFGSVRLESSGTQAVTLTNTGTAAVTITKSTVSGSGFSLTGLALPVTLSPGSTTSFDAVFRPTAAGTTSGSVSFVSNATGSPTVVSLAGTGSSFQISVSPGSLNFGNVAVGSGVSQQVTLTNAGTASLDVTQVTATGAGYTLSGLALPVVLAAGQRTSFNALFSPKTGGSATGSISVISNASNSLAVVPLSGVGLTLQLSVSPGIISFGDAATGVIDKQAVTLANTGTSSVTVSKVTVTGAGFSLSGLTLPLVLEAGDQTSFNAVFSPSATGNTAGSISIVSSASSAPTSIVLSGAGVTLQLAPSPGSLSFGNVTVNSTSTQSVTLKNTGTSSVTVTKANLTGAGFSISGLTLPLTLAGGRSAGFSATFAPGTSGSATGSISVVSNASNSPAVVSVSGTGVTRQLSVSPSMVAFGNVNVGTKATQTVSLTNTGTSAVTVTQAKVTGTGFSLGSLTLPFTLGAGAHTSLSAGFSPTRAGNATGSISIVSNASNSPGLVALSGTGATLQLSASPSSVAFGNITVGSKSTQSLTLANTGTSSVTLTQAIVTGSGFSISGPTLPLTLAAGHSAGFSASFTPGTSGNVTGSISVASNATNSPSVVSLSGTGITLQLSASPSAIAFGNVTVGTTGTQAVTLTNTGTGSVTVSQATASGTGFGVSGLTLPLTLSGGQSTSFNTTFAPTSTGSPTGSISIASNATNSPATVSLSATGVTLLLSASPGSIGFGNVTVGSTSPQPVTLTNTGTGSVTVTQATVTGTGFSTTGLTLPLTLSGGQSTGFNATFAPTSTGSPTGSISIASNATNSPAAVSLSGTGVTLQLSASPSTVAFGNVTVGRTGTQSVTLTNTGTGSVTVTQATVTGTGFSTTGLTLPLTLSGGQSTSFNATFAPTSTGSPTGSISILSNASNSPAAVSLSGTGVTLQLSLSSGSLTFGDVVVNNSSEQTILVTNTGTASVTINQATVTGTGFSTTGLTLPLTIANGDNASFDAVFAPTAAGTASGNIALVSSATNSPNNISLSGDGVNSHSASLSWTASDSPNISGYNVYRGSASGGPYTLLNSSLVAGTTYTDTTVQAGQTYYYVSTALNSSDQESAYSNEAQAAVPSP